MIWERAANESENKKEMTKPTNRQNKSQEKKIACLFYSEDSHFTLNSLSIKKLMVLFLLVSDFYFENIYFILFETYL